MDPGGAALRSISWVVRRIPVNRRIKAAFIRWSLAYRPRTPDFTFHCARIGIHWSAAGFPDLLTRHMLFEGMYQEDVLVALRALVRPGDVVYDVGGHHGLMAVVAGLAVGPQGRVVTFEPNPAARAHLTHHLALNGVRNVTVEDLALSDTEGEVRFFVQKGDVSWNSTLIQAFATSDWQSIQVKTQPLDHYVARSGLVPHVIKIDTEGSEFLVLQGAREMLRAHRPVVIMEFNPLSARAAGTTIAQFVRFLEGEGYRLIVLRRSFLGYFSFADREPFDEARHLKGDNLANVVAVPERIPLPTGTVAVARRAALRASGALGGLVGPILLGPVRRWREPARSRALDHLLASQWWSRERLEQEQWTALRAMLRHAHDNVPYYRDAFRAAGIHPDDLHEPSQVAALPVVRKTDIQNHAARLRASEGFEHRGVYTNYTGGSTGTPLELLQDADYQAWGMAELDRDFRMCGYVPGQRQAFLWGSDRDAKAHRGLRGTVRDLFNNLRWVDTFDLSVPRLRQALAELGVFQPHLVVGYVSSLTLAARLLESEGIPRPRPGAIQTSAEVLAPPARELVERAFGAPCFDRYGCREVGNIAHECDAHLGLHLLMESNYAEVVRSDGSATEPGEPGEIVVTNLRNRVMPLVRYATGDVGVKLSHGCTCGRGAPLLARIQGRVSDIIVSPGGKLLHGEFFTHLFYGVAGIRQFQVEQVTRERLVVRMVAESGESYDAACVLLRDLILRHGDAAFQLDFARLDHIAPGPSGKYCFTISRVPVTLSERTPYAVA